VTARASAHGTADRLETAAAGPTGIVAWYAQGFADRLGDRLLLFDNTGAPPLELLRVAQRLTGDPAFEPALRERVEELKPFRHPAFARVRGVSVLAEPSPQLALVSEHIPGERLSQILRAARAAGFRPDPGTALWLVRQLMPAIAALHEMGGEIAHGTLSPDRIIVTPTGDLVVTEYVFAHALESLGAEPADLWRELGVAVSPRARQIDQRGDIEQVALLALAVLLGRPLGRDEYPRHVRALLDEACDPLRWSLVPPLRAWLNRALVLDRSPFATAREALETLDRLLPRVSGMWASRLLPQNVAAPETGRAAHIPAEAGRPLEMAPATEPHASPAPSTPFAIAGAAAPVELSVPAESGSQLDMPPRARRGEEAAATRADNESDAERSRSAGAVDAQTLRRLWLLCGGLTIVAIVEALCILALLASRA
jgi:hypothetical protein